MPNQPRLPHTPPVMRVPDTSCRDSDQTVRITPHRTTTPQASHASQRSGTYRIPRPLGCHRFRYPLRGRMPADQFSRSPNIESSGFFVSAGDSPPPARRFATMASADFPGHFLRGISPGKNACLRHTTAPFTFRMESNSFAVVCQLTQSGRPSMRFLFIGSWLSPRLPPDGRLPFRP